jgi:hypothetical protein
MTNRFVTLVAVAACAVAAAGCAVANRVIYSPINEPPRALAQRDPASVDLFVGKTPARPYVEVGLFEVYQGLDDDGVGRSTEDMIGTLRAHGGRRGCDAVQVLGVEVTGRNSGQRVVRGVCVMYNDEQARLAAGRP